MIKKPLTHLFFFLIYILMPLAAMTGCASLPANNDKTPLYALTDTQTTTLGMEVQPLLQMHSGQSGFYALPEGKEAYAARLWLIDKAQSTIDVQYYIWHHDLTGKAMFYALLAAADRGVRVRMLLDDLDTAGKDDILRVLDAHPQIEVRLFNPFANRNRRVSDFLTDTSRVNHRMHNKSIIIDGQVSVFGGRNIGDEYFDAEEDVGFSDMDVIAIGGVTDDVSEAYDTYWNSLWSYPLAAFYRDTTPITEQQSSEYKQTLQAFWDKAVRSDYAAALWHLPIAATENIAEFNFQWGNWQLEYDSPSKVAAKKIAQETHIAPRLKKIVDAAEQEIIIVSPYFVPGKEVTAYLVDKVKQGVRVVVVTNSLAANDVALVHAGYMRYRKTLIRGGVELYEFKSKKSKVLSAEETSGMIDRWRGSSRASLHAKYFCVDQKSVFVGSFNLDNRSVALNTELGVYFESPYYASMVHKGVDDLILKKAYRVSLVDGDLQWLTLDNGQEKIYNKEPEVGFWKRVGVHLLSTFVPESQL